MSTTGMHAFDDARVFFSTSHMTYIVTSTHTGSVAADCSHSVCGLLTGETTTKCSSTTCMYSYNGARLKLDVINKKHQYYECSTHTGLIVYYVVIVVLKRWCVCVSERAIQLVARWHHDETVLASREVTAEASGRSCHTLLPQKNQPLCARHAQPMHNIPHATQ